MKQRKRSRMQVRKRFHWFQVVVTKTIVTPKHRFLKPGYEIVIEDKFL